MVVNYVDIQTESFQSLEEMEMSKSNKVNNEMMEIMLKVMVAAVLVRLNMDGHVMEHLQFDRSVEMAR